jgi:hypothetical protein
MAAVGNKELRKISEHYVKLPPMSDNNAAMTTSCTLSLIFLLAVWQVEALSTILASNEEEHGEKSFLKDNVSRFSTSGFFPESASSKHQWQMKKIFSQKVLNIFF